MRNKRILRDAVILTVFSLIMRVSAIAFSMFLSSHIGAQGVGLNQLVFSAFSFAVTFATAGISVAVTKILTEEYGRGVRGSESPVLRAACAYALAVSAVSAAALFGLAPYIGRVLLRDARTAAPLRYLSSALPLMALSACFKGYLLAVRRASHIAVSDFLEQGVEVGVLAALLHFLPTDDAGIACRYIAVSIVLSELASLIYLLAQAARARPKSAARAKNAYFRRLLRVSLPVAASACLASLLRTAENISIPSGLERAGLAREAALADYGAVRGMAIPVLFLPYAFLASFTSLALPEVSESMAAGQDGAVRALVRRVVRDCLLLAIPAAAVYLLFADALGEAIYHSASVSRVLAILAPLVPLMYFDAVADGILKGMGQQNWVLKLNIADCLVRVALVYLLIPRFGFAGFMALMYVSNILNPVLSIRRCLRLSGLRLDLRGWIVRPALASGAAALCLRALRLSFPLARCAPLPLAAEIALFALLYAAVLSLLQEKNARQDAAHGL